MLPFRFLLLRLHRLVLLGFATGIALRLPVERHHRLTESNALHFTNESNRIPTGTAAHAAIQVFRRGDGEGRGVLRMERAERFVFFASLFQLEAVRLCHFD